MFTSFMCDFNNFSQLIDIKNDLGNVLDLAFTNLQTQYFTVEESSDPLPIKIDKNHPPIQLTLKLSKRKKIVKNFICDLHKLPEKVFCYKQGDYISMVNNLKNLDWEEVLKTPKDLNLALEKFYSIINQNIKEYIPSKIIKELKFPVWASPEYKSIIFQKKIA
uniref:Uncharacterized protein n=1 Tax=Cacopsylla melanoneura TaxID=428564 RepID=A0A8D8M8X9_9HEMI